jgi:hypothetical protein
MTLLKLNFTNHKEAQDMIKLIAQEKNLSVTESVQFAINFDNYRCALETGWGVHALPFWGHSDHRRKWQKLDNPKIEVELNSEEFRLLEDLAQKEAVDIETALAYFLIFSMEALGYHI